MCSSSLLQGMALAESLAKRVEQHGGAALIIDYGQVGRSEVPICSDAVHIMLAVNLAVCVLRSLPTAGDAQRVTQPATCLLLPFPVCPPSLT